MQSTTIRVSRKVLEMLSSSKDSVGARSYDEAILMLLREYRRDIIEKYFGVDRGRIKEFTEEDRIEDREIWNDHLLRVISD